MRVLVIAVAVAVQGLVMAGTAAAASTTVSASPGTVSVVDGTLVVRAAAGQDNRVTIAVSAGRVVVTDTVALTPGEGCRSAGRATVSCAAVRRIHVVLGAGDDSVDLGGVGDEPVVAEGGAGDDWVTGGAGHDTLFGGMGADVLSGGKGGDHLYGGPGTDKLYGGPDADTLDGGTDDDLIDGTDAMRDSVDYGARTSSVTVDLAAGTGGEAAEQDTILNVPDINGGQGDDTLVGDPGSNVINGNDGADTIDGAGGYDLCNTGETVLNCP